MNNLTDTFVDLQAATDAWKREIEEVKRLKEVNRNLIDALEIVISEFNRGTSGRLIINTKLEKDIKQLIENCKS